jgi:hypothetical protein
MAKVFEGSLALSFSPALKGVNPKRAGAAKRFALYAGSPTVADYVAAVVAAKLGDAAKAYRDLAWDSAAPREWVRIGPVVSAPVSKAK